MIQKLHISYVIICTLYSSMSRNSPHFLARMAFIVTTLSGFLYHGHVSLQAQRWCTEISNDLGMLLGEKLNPLKKLKKAAAPLSKLSMPGNLYSTVEAPASSQQTLPHWGTQGNAVSKHTELRKKEFSSVHRQIGTRCRYVVVQLGSAWGFLKLPMGAMGQAPLKA